MRNNYEDIRSRIAEQPSWYDSNGAPRYGEFEPSMCPNIYARQVFLLRIACQRCGEQFLVEMNSGWFNKIYEPRILHYGDPPVHGCVGDTMNCDDLEVVQVWNREDCEWVRHSEMEGVIDE